MRGVRVSTVSEEKAREHGGVRAYARHRGVNHNAVRKAIETKRLEKSVSYVNRAGRMVPDIDFEIADREWYRNTDPVQAARTGKVTTPPDDAVVMVASAAEGTRLSRQRIEPLIEDPAGLRNTSVRVVPGCSAASSPDGEELLGGNNDAHSGAYKGEIKSPQKSSATSSPTPDLLTVEGEVQPEVAPGVAARQSGDLDGPVPPGASPRTEPAYLDSRAKRERFLAEQAELDYLKAVGKLVPADDVERENLEIWKQVKANVLRANSKMAVLIAAETDPAKVERLLNDSDNKVFDELSRTFADDEAEGAEERAEAVP